MTLKTINKTFKTLESNVYYSFVDLIDKSNNVSYHTNTKSIKFKAVDDMHPKFCEITFIGGDIKIVDNDGYLYNFNMFSLKTMIEILNQISK